MTQNVPTEWSFHNYLLTRNKMIRGIILFSLIVILGVISVSLFNLVSKAESEIGWTQLEREEKSAEDREV